MTHTSTYVTLEISQASFDDIKTRIEAAGVLDDYLVTMERHGDIPRRMLLFGSIGFLREFEPVEVDITKMRDSIDLAALDIKPFEAPMKNAALIAVDKAGEEALKNDPSWQETPIGTDPVAGFTDEEALRQSQEILYCRSHDFGLCKAHRDVCGSLSKSKPCRFEKWPGMESPWCAVCLGRLKP